MKSSRMRAETNNAKTATKLIEASTVVKRSAPDVWAYIADLSMLKAWDPDVLEVTWTPPVTLDQTFTIVVESTPESSDLPSSRSNLILARGGDNFR